MNRPCEPGLRALLDPAPTGKWSAERVLAVRQWSPNLFSFRTTRYRAFRFVAGQFARLGIAREDGALVWRAYSIASAAYDEHLEFFSVVVPDGEFTSRLARLRPGDRILVDKSAYGYLTADRFGDGDDLWLLASGTGLAPFLAILHDPAVWAQYKRLILVHSARRAAELAYRAEIERLPQAELLAAAPGQLRYLPVVTREACPGVLDARITALIEDGRLEAAAGLRLDPARSRLMICGNPEMARDLRRQLTARGFSLARRDTPGQLAFENYW